MTRRSSATYENQALTVGSPESEPLTFVSPRTHVALRMFDMQVLASQLHFPANKNAELAIPPLFWPFNCIKIGGHVALLSDPTVYPLYCDQSMRRVLGCFCEGTVYTYIAFTRSHWPEVAIPDSYDKCEPRLKAVFNLNRIVAKRSVFFCVHVISSAREWQTSLKIKVGTYLHEDTL